MPTEAELNPNTRLIDNRFAAQIAENEALRKYVAEQGLSWDNDEDFIKMVLDLILSSEQYREYLNNENDSYETDKEFWRIVFKKLICGNEAIDDYLQDKSIYWNDDISIVETFTLKTIKQFEETAGSKSKLLPMFKVSQTSLSAIKLSCQSLMKGSEFRERINKHMKNWETERIANMDLIIMQVALAEIMDVPDNSHQCDAERIYRHGQILQYPEKRNVYQRYFRFRSQRVKKRKVIAQRLIIILTFVSVSN